MPSRFHVCMSHVPSLLFEYDDAGQLIRMRAKFRSLVNLK